jgi:NADH dehydrogenase
MLQQKKTVVIGGGFAGLGFIEKLDTEHYPVLLIDRSNHHQFQPLFYQVATSQLEPSSISFPFRKVFQKKKNVQIRMAEVKAIDTGRNVVVTDIGNFDYDILVIACGCTTNFFGNSELAKYALTLKSTSDAITVRNHILLNFEKLVSASPEEKEELLNILIVGGGPTGVELAGSFAEIKKNILPRDYPDVDFSELHILLVEGSDKTLGSMSPIAQEASKKYLKELGVTVCTHLLVKEYDGKIATLSNGNRVKTQNLIWAAGVTGNSIAGLTEESAAPGKRLKVNRLNKVQGYSTIFAIGDIALMETPKYPKGHPQLANVAINQAKNLARNLNAEIKGKSWREYEYKDLGAMATIGKNKAVVDLPHLKFKGYLAWFVWMFLHLMLILSVRNKLIIFVNWAWNYVTKDTSLRLILNPGKK